MEINTTNLNQSTTNTNAQLAELQVKSRHFRWNAAMTYHKVAPALSRIMMLQFMKSTDIPTTLKARVQRGICNFCGSIFMPGNHTLRIASKSQLPKDIKKLKRMQNEASWKLKGLHKKYIASIQTRASKMIYRCLKCRKCTKLHLENSPNQVSKSKNFQRVVPQTENKTQIQKKMPSLPAKITDTILRSNKQHLLDSTKNKNKKKKKKQQKNGNFCQLKSLLKAHNLENTMKSRLESFLATV